ncbi:MAG TPA: methyltransferase domain-containing protein [Acidimicrobiia bacterium]|nr:methyltransferase domain-containing protein [Acidimicrobiia bacterium]
MTYTHGHHESVLRSHTWRTVENSAAYLMAELQPGRDLLDVGCGPGTITLDFARRLAPGRVVAIDAAADVIELARQSAPAVANVTFATGDVYALDFDDASFDIVHAHQVLQHLADPVKALREMRRVCKPGGVVAARDGDYGAFTWFPEPPALDAWRATYSAIARANHGEPNAGRHLLEWTHAAGFADVQPGASTWCHATPDERAWWGGLWADRITTSAIAEQAVRDGFASQAELEAMADGWREWAAHPDGWYAVVHGEILCRVPH